MADIKCDRRAILSLIGPHFPSLDPKITSDELHGFLDAQTGLETPLDEPNGAAFDKWRQALAKQGIPVWNITPERVAAIKVRGAELKAAELQRVADNAALLIELAKVAPAVTAEELLGP